MTKLEAAAAFELTKYLAAEGREPFLLIVDEELLKAFGTVFSMLVQAIDNLKNAVSMNEPNLFKVNSGILCKDASELHLAIIVAASLLGESNIERVRTEAISAGLRVKVAFSVPKSGTDFVPFCICPLGESEFRLTVEKCLPPSPFLLEIDKSSSYDLDLDTDFSSQYKANLKRVSLALTYAVSNQLGWDVSESVYSIGFGAGLVANTVCANFPESRRHPSSPATILIIDRTLDWWAPLSSSQKTGATQSLCRLYDQLVMADQSEDILPQICIALRENVITKQAALAIALRAASFAGQGWRMNTKSMDELSNQLGVSATRLTRLLNEAANARLDCGKNASADGEDESGFGQMMSVEEPLIETILRRALDEGIPIPNYLVRARTFDVTNVARNIFGTVFGGSDTHKKSKDAEIRVRSKLIVFFLGGYSPRDVQGVQNALANTKIQQFYVGGTERLKQNEVETQLFQIASQVDDAATHSGAIKSSGPKDFSALFG